MEQYIDKSAALAEVENIKSIEFNEGTPSDNYACMALDMVIETLDTLEVKEVEEPASIAYVVTRCEEHSDYVEKVFFDEHKAQEYCDQFKGNENEYARHITRVEVAL